MKNQKGFGVVEAIIVIAVIVLLGFAGWFVWDKQHNKDSDKDAAKKQTQTSQTNTESSKQEDSQPAAPVIPEGWKVYKNTSLGFSFAYPMEWGTFDVTHSGQGDMNLFLANFVNPDKSSASIELRGHRADVRIENSDSAYAKGFIKQNGKYFVRGADGPANEIKPEDILLSANTRLGEVIVIRNTFSAVVSGLGEIYVNLPATSNIVGLKLTFSHERPDGSLYTPAELETLKQVAKTFDTAN